MCVCVCVDVWASCGCTCESVLVCIQETKRKSCILITNTARQHGRHPLNECTHGHIRPPQHTFDRRTLGNHPRADLRTHSTPRMLSLQKQPLRPQHSHLCWCASRPPAGSADPARSWSTRGLRGNGSRGSGHVSSITVPFCFWGPGNNLPT